MRYLQRSDDIVDVGRGGDAVDRDSAAGGAASKAAQAIGWRQGLQRQSSAGLAPKVRHPKRHLLREAGDRLSGDGEVVDEPTMPPSCIFR